jgi:hypothetical protein
MDPQPLHRPMAHNCCNKTRFCAPPWNVGRVGTT